MYKYNTGYIHIIQCYIPVPYSSTTMYSATMYSATMYSATMYSAIYQCYTRLVLYETPENTTIFVSNGFYYQLEYTILSRYKTRLKRKIKPCEHRQ